MRPNLQHAFSLCSQFWLGFVKILTWIFFRDYPVLVEWIQSSWSLINFQNMVISWVCHTRSRPRRCQTSSPKKFVCLHGVSVTIVSDRDPIFLSSFWKELFKLMDTKLQMSSDYHPETDGQSEILNRCVETYLCCSASERSKGWSKWLAWVEFCYNIGFQSGTDTTPFEVVYGRQLLLGKFICP